MTSGRIFNLATLGIDVSEAVNVDFLNKAFEEFIGSQIADINTATFIKMG